jgi:hypothetical protein
MAALPAAAPGAEQVRDFYLAATDREEERDENLVTAARVFAALARSWPTTWEPTRRWLRTRSRSCASP